MTCVHGRWVVLALTFLLTGPFACGTEAQPPESGAETAAGETIVRAVRFVTVRNRTDNARPEEYFGGGRGTVRTGTATISWTPISFLTELSDKLDFYLPTGDIELEAIEESDPASFWRELQDSSRGARPVLYVHGYKMTFERGSGRAALFQWNLGLESRFIWFSWPSDGNPMGYTVDETDLDWSTPYLETVLDRLGELFGDGGFDIVAHSLGTRGVVQALLDHGSGPAASAPRVNELVLVAADMDAGIFRQHVDQLRRLARNVTLYVSSGDAALRLSQEIHGYPRLGQAGAHLQGLDGIEIIDVSDLNRSRASGHIYHLYHQAVIDDLDQLLNHAKRASQRPGLRHVDGAWRLQNVDG